MRWSIQYERLPVYGTRHAIATSHPAATAVGLAVLEGGGNAVDAALAAHAVLGVVEPGMTGVGGDCFALYYEARTRRVVAINGSGRTPAAQSTEVAPADLVDTSAIAVTVPAAVDAWCRLSADFGTRGLAELLAPAIRIAAEGAPVHARVAWDWQGEAARLATDPVTRAIFLPNGRAPVAGERHAQPLLAETLRRIAREGRAGFYEGEVAEDMVRTLRARGGAHTLDDFAACRADYVAPIETSIAGTRVLECPPNSQGVTALFILDLYARAIAMRPAADEAEKIHVLAEATRIGYGVRDATLADERFLGRSVAEVLAEDGLASHAVSLGAATADSGANTVYLCVVDGDGNAISFINSIYDCFGSCIVAPKSGVLFNNRGMCFTTEPGHPNLIGPGKRPLHTIIPGMLLDAAGNVVGPFGVMGGQYQATGHADFLRRILLDGLDAQAAINAPRTFWADGGLRAEPILDRAIVAELARRGHRMVPWDRPIGGAQAIIVDRSKGTLLAASDPRKDGCALAM